MIALFIVAVLWSGMHSASLPEHAPQFRDSTIQNKVNP